MNASAQLVEAPASDANYRYETLGYVDAYDAVLNCDYAFVAYREIESSGDWRVRIKSSQTAGAVFEPAMMRSKCREAEANGKAFFVWGYNFEPSDGDPRQIEFRVYPGDNKPSEIEMLLRLRKADHTPGPEKSIRFPWPG